MKQIHHLLVCVENHPFFVEHGPVSVVVKRAVLNLSQEVLSVNHLKLCHIAPSAIKNGQLATVCCVFQEECRVVFLFHESQSQRRVRQVLVPFESKTQALVLSLIDDRTPLVSCIQVESSSLNGDAPIADAHSSRLTKFALLLVIVEKTSDCLELREVNSANYGTLLGDTYLL